MKLVVRLIWLLIVSAATIEQLNLANQVDTYNSLGGARRSEIVVNPTEENPAHDKPWLVLHVGPPKTYTSSIQHELHELQEYMKLDNYSFYCPWYKGTLDKNTQRLGDAIIASQRCDQNSNCLQRRHLSNSVQRFLNQTASPNLIFSNEWFSIERDHKWDYSHLRRVLEPQWNIVVIVAYRRYFEWLPSVKHQWEDETIRKDFRKSWPRENTMAMNLSVSSVWEKIEHLWRNASHKDYHYNFHYTDQSLRVLRPLVTSQKQMKLLNLHDDRSQKGLLSHFLCHLVPAAKQTCQRARDIEMNRTGLVVKNKAVSYMSDDLAVAAAQLGLIHRSNISRPTARMRIKEFDSGSVGVPNGTNGTVPMSCPTRTQVEPLLQKSLELERGILPHFSQTARDKHVQSFWDEFENGKFCSPNLRAILEEERWRVFLSSLRNEEK